MNRATKVPSSHPFLIFGVGSPHGDDRFGWEVAARLSDLVPSGVTVRAVASPIDILALLPASPCSILLIDACAGYCSGTDSAGGEAAGGELVELTGQAIATHVRAANSTHSISVADLVPLARNLHLPVVNWYFLGYTANACHTETPLSPAAHLAVRRAVERAMQIMTANRRR